MAQTWICDCCGEVNQLVAFDPANALKSVCWECGMPRVAAPVATADNRSEEEKIDEATAKMYAAAEKIFPVLVSKLATESKFRLHELIVATCKKNGAVFAKRFASLVTADERFSPVVSVMSPAQREGRF